MAIASFSGCEITSFLFLYMGQLLPRSGRGSEHMPHVESAFQGDQALLRMCLVKKNTFSLLI